MAATKTKTAKRRAAGSEPERVQIMMMRTLAKRLAKVLPHIGSHHSRVHHALNEYIESVTKAGGRGTGNGETRGRRAAV